MANEGLTFSVKVSPRAAILAGKTAVGMCKVTLTSEDLAHLGDPVREELALAYETGVPIGDVPGDPPISEPSYEGILPVLEARAAARVKQREAERAAEARRREEALVVSRELTAKDNARSKALRRWVEQNGDDDLKARMAEGYLPEQEILEAVADDKLSIVGYSEYEPMYKGDVCDCGCGGAVVFTADAPKYMDTVQHAKLRELRETAPDGAIVEPVLHRGSCPLCKCVPLERLAARVSLPWEGWRLVRDFSL